MDVTTRTRANLRPALAADLPAAGLLPDARGRIPLAPAFVAAALADGRAVRIKHGTHRSVYRLDLPYGRFVLKRDRQHRLGRRLLSLVRSSAAHREWSKSREMLRRGVPTIDAIGYRDVYERGLLRESFLLSREIPGVCPLDHYLTRELPRLPESQRRRMRRRLAEHLAELVAGAHQAGVDHNDLHPGNILIQADAHTACQLYLIDVPGVRLARAARPLSWRRCRANLVMLRAAFERLADLRDYARFWRNYCRSRSEARLPTNAPAQIESRVDRYLRRLHRSRDKRSLHENRDFHPFATAALRGHVVAEMAANDWVSRLPQPAELMPDPFSRDATNGWRKPFERRIQPPFALPAPAARVVVLAFPAGRGWERPWAWIRSSAALRLWYIGHAVDSRSIPICRPIAVVEASAANRPRMSYLMIAWPADGTMLDDYAARLASCSAQTHLRRARAAAVSIARLLGRLHRWRFEVGGVAAGRLVICEQSGEVTARLLDGQGVKPRRFLGWRRAVRDLARVSTALGGFRALSRTDRLRCLRAYLVEARLGTRCWKARWRDIGRALARHGN